MDHARAHSSPMLLTSTSNHGQRDEESGLEGLATNVRLLLKLIQDHNGACTKDNVERKFQRVNGMMCILEEAKSRISKIQSSTRRKAELRRCNTDLKPNIPIPRDRRTPDVSTDEKERLRRELSASLMARQSLQAMCSSLGKEKQIMASELARKAQELTEMEEFISDLKAQNDMLLGKLHACNSEQKKEKKGSYNGGESEGNIVLQERNKALSEQLQRTIDGYRSLKRRMKDLQEENKDVHVAMEEMEMEVQAGIDRIHIIKEEIATIDVETSSVTEEISVFEGMLESLSMKISKHTQKKT